jgi:hypothetical protein
MALLDHNGESEFPFSKDLVFEALCIAIPTIHGMKIETADQLSGRVVVKSGISLHSWGENIPIQLSGISQNRTQIRITSSPKTGIMFGGAIDMGKNRKNIEEILSATSRILASYQTKSTDRTATSRLTNFHGQVNLHHGNIKLQKSEWYEKTWLVVLLCILFFPVGLYALWKNSSINKGWKIAISIFITVLVIANINSEKETVQAAAIVGNPDDKLSEETAGTMTENVTETKTETSPTDRGIIKDKLKAKAERDWPNDYTTQEYWISEQLDAYDYMLGIENNSIKEQAQRDWPLDFSTQKYWYNEQLEARERMNK